MLHSRLISFALVAVGVSTAQGCALEKSPIVFEEARDVSSQAGGGTAETVVERDADSGERADDAVPMTSAGAGGGGSGGGGAGGTPGAADAASATDESADAAVSGGGLDDASTDGFVGGPSDGSPGASDAADAGDSDAAPDAASDAADSAPPEEEPRPLCGVAKETVVVAATIVVAAGETFDGECQRHVAGQALLALDGAPMFRLEQGARLVNTVIGWPTADGVHTYGDATLSNVVWPRVGDDALTIKQEGTVEIDRGRAGPGSNTVFQVNAPSTLRISRFVARGADKFVRQDGGTEFRVDLYIDGCDISQMSEAIFRTDSGSSRVTMTDTRFSQIGEALFLGVAPQNITASGNTPY